MRTDSGVFEGGVGGVRVKPFTGRGRGVALLLLRSRTPYGDGKEDGDAFPAAQEGGDVELSVPPRALHISS